MISTSKDFKRAAGRDEGKTTTLSFRVTPVERAYLEDKAAGLPMSAFLKDRLLGDATKPRRACGKRPIKDFDALARILGKLGRADLPNRMARLILAIEEGRALIDDDLVAELRASIADITLMRRDLVQALGLKSD